MKFRAKDISGKWVFGSNVAFDNKLINVNGQFIPIDPATVGRLSNRLDDDGKEIFEGDILEADDEFGQVFCVDNKWFVADPEIWNAYGLYDYDLPEPRSVKVVGNVFDNPDFFKKKYRATEDRT